MISVGLRLGPRYTMVGYQYGSEDQSTCSEGPGLGGTRKSSRSTAGVEIHPPSATYSIDGLGPSIALYSGQ